MKTAGRYSETEESVFKPLSLEEEIIRNTSPGDMLLFMIALDKKNREQFIQAPFPVIGIND